MGIFDWMPVIGKPLQGAADTLVGGVGDAYEDYMSVGKNRFQEAGFTPELTDQSGLGMDAARRAGDMSQYAFNEMVGGRGAQASEDPRLAGMATSTADQGQSLDLLRGAAMGNAPSAAEGAYMNALNRGMAQQRGVAAGARGSAGLALAQGGLGANIAGMQTQAANDMSQIRANEMAQARGMYNQGATQARGQNIDRMGLNNQMAMGNAKLQNDYRMGMGQTAASLGQTGIGYYNAGINAGLGREELRGDMYNQAQNRAAGVNQANADRRGQQADRITNTVLGIGRTSADSVMGQGGK